MGNMKTLNKYFKTPWKNEEDDICSQEFITKLMNHLRDILQGLQWDIKGVLRKTGEVIPYPKAPQQ